MRRGRVAQDRLYSKDRKRNITSNPDRGDRTAGKPQRNRKKSEKCTGAQLWHPWGEGEAKTTTTAIRQTRQPR
jgi:hypothetical protein